MSKYDLPKEKTREEIVDMIIQTRKFIEDNTDIVPDLHQYYVFIGALEWVIGFRELAL